MLRPVVAEALRRARSLAESLDSRGFDPEAPRAVARSLRLKRWEPPLLVAAFGLTASVVAMRLLFVLYSSEMLYVPRLRPLYGFIRQWL
jgi:energy-coupling factor transport system permease protein